MLIQAAQTMSFGGTTVSEQTVVLKATQPYTGIRIAFEHVVTATGELVAGTESLDLISQIVVDVPEYGSNSRRVDMDTNTVYMLPMFSQLASIGSSDAASATSTDSGLGTDAIDGFAYYDIPTNVTNIAEDTRITIRAAASAGANTLNVSFALLDKPMRQVYYRAYQHGAGTSNVQQWFPSDGTLLGVIVGATDGTPVAGDIYNSRDADAISRISLDGEQATTFSNPELLAAGLDEVISGGGVSDESFAALDVYSMLQNFPIAAGARYVQVDRNDSVGLLIGGVLTDA